MRRYPIFGSLSSEFGRVETFNLKCRYKEQDRSTEGPVLVRVSSVLVFSLHQVWRSEILMDFHSSDTED